MNKMTCVLPYGRIMSQGVCYLMLSLLVLYCLISPATVVNSKSITSAEDDAQVVSKRELPAPSYPLDLDDLAQLGLTDAELEPFIEKYMVPAKKLGKPNKFRFRFRFRQ